MKYCYYVFLKDKKGISAISFAVIAPVALCLIFVSIEFSLIMLAGALMDSAVVQASRYGLTGNDYTQGNFSINAGCNNHNVQKCRENLIKRTIDNRAGLLLDTTRLVIQTTASQNVTDIAAQAQSCRRVQQNCTDLGLGSDFVTYNISYDWEYFTPFLPALAGNTITLRSSTVVKNENF